MYSFDSPGPEFWGVFCKCVLYTRPSSMLDLHIVLLKDRAVPAIKGSHHDSELQMISEMASNVSVLLAIGAQVLVTLSFFRSCRALSSCIETAFLTLTLLATIEVWYMEKNPGRFSSKNVIYLWLKKGRHGHLGWHVDDQIIRKFIFW